jgi:hypothetical protein
MEYLTGTRNPFFPGKVHVFEYDNVGSRRHVFKPRVEVLFDDSIGEVGAKLNVSYPGACWWIRRHATALEIERDLRNAGSSQHKIMRALMPEGDSAERKRALSDGGAVHVCPYLDGVFNAAVQCAMGLLPGTPARKRIAHSTLSSMTSYLEIHFISSDELKKTIGRDASEYESPREPMESTVSMHPSPPPPDFIRPGNVSLSSTRLCVTLPQAVDARALFSGAKLTVDAFAVARVESSGEAVVRVLEEAVRDERADVASLRELSSPPRADCAYIAFPVRSDGTVTVTEAGDLTFDCIVRDPALIADAWARTKSTCTECLALSAGDGDPEVRFVSLTCNVPLRGTVEARRILHVIRASFASYLDAAIASDGSVECIYRRSSGPRRFPACVEQVLTKHARGARSLNASIEILETTHSVERGQARKMAGDFNPRLFRTPAPAAVRVSVANGVKMLLYGTSVGDVHRAMTVACLALMEATGTKSTDKEAAVRNVAGILESAEQGDTLGEMSEKAEEARAGIAPTGISGLINADPELFKFKQVSKRKTYARSCGPHRQPIAVADAELETMGEDAPASIKAGPKRLNYICPEVWCEGSRTAMTREQANVVGWRCPDGDAAVDMMAASWWRGAPTRYVGFLKTTTHPDGFAMPCCFKTFGKMQKEREQVFRKDSGSGPEPGDERPEGIVRPGRYVMSANTVPLPIGRRGEVNLGDQARMSGVVRVGVDQRSHTFLEAAAVLEEISLASMLERVIEALTPTNVAFAASGSVMAYLMSRSPLDLRGDGVRGWFSKYAETEAGATRLGQRGMRSLVSSGAFHMRDPDVAREAVVAHAYVLAVESVRTGDRASTRMIQLLVLAALGKRYPEVSVSGGETYLSCTRWDERAHTGVVCGLMFRDGRYLEPLDGVSSGMLDEVSQMVSEACGSAVKSENYAILELLSRLKHIVVSQVCDEAHSGVGVVIEGNLFVPFPEPHIVDPVRPLVYQAGLECADGRWTVDAVRELFDTIKQTCSVETFAQAVYGRHCVRVGDAVVPLQGGAACLAEHEVRARVLAISKTSESMSTSETRALGKRARIVRGVLDRIVSENDLAYVALASPLSPLTSQQKQAVFESILGRYNMVNDKDAVLNLKYTEIFQANSDDLRPRPGEVFVTDEDIADGSAEFALGIVSSGADGAFNAARVVPDLTVRDPVGLDETVPVPDAVVGWDTMVGKTSSSGSLEAVSFVIGLAGGAYAKAQHGRRAAHRALLNWHMTGQLDPGWPGEAKPLLQRALTHDHRAPSWKKLVLLGQSVEPTDEDIAVAFANVPVQLELIRNGGKVVSSRRQAAPWKVIVWRAEDGRAAFATRRGSALIPKPVSRTASHRLDDSGTPSET